MGGRSWTGAEVRFIDYDRTLCNIREAVTAAKAARPEIAKVFLIGSLAAGDWTADSDADLVVVVNKDLEGFSSRSPYHIFVRGIATDSLVFSLSEFDRLSCEPGSFLAGSLATAVEL